MILAMGQPGQLPRQWAQGPEAFCKAQMLPGEVSAPAALDNDGRPIAAPLPDAPAA